MGMRGPVDVCWVVRPGIWSAGGGGAGCELPNEHPPAARQRGRTHRCPLLGSVIDTRVPMRVGMTSLRTFSRPFFAKPQNDDFSCAQLSLCAQL